MSNRIRELSVSQTRYDPAEAWLWITVYPEQVTSATQVLGRLTGPQCHYSSTVEIAYPLREHSRQYEKEGTPRLIHRVIIPEPNFWEPGTPFLYRGAVELWQKGQRCDQREICHGLRQSRLTPQGLRWNSQILTIRAAARDQCSEADAFRLRQEGYNTLLLAKESVTPELLEIADRLGFLILGHLTSRKQFKDVQPPQTHTSFLGWIIDERLLEDPLVASTGGCLLSGENRLVGVELTQRPADPLPGEVDFILCREDLLPELSENPLPKLLRYQTGSFKDEAAPPPGVLGWVWP
jgi:hypothetical protein